MCLLLWCGDLKPAIDVAKAELCALKLYKHVGMLGLLRCDKLNGHRHKVCSCSSYLRPKIHFAMRGIAALHLKNFNAPVQIEDNEVRGRVCRFMSNKGVCLVGSGC